MNDEIKEALKQFNREDLIDDGYEHNDLDTGITVSLTLKQMIKYIQLQSNWNSLREWLEQQYAIVKSNSIQEPNNSEWYIKWNERKHVLDKMNELEGDKDGTMD